MGSEQTVSTTLRLWAAALGSGAAAAAQQSGVGCPDAPEKTHKLVRLVEEVCSDRCFIASFVPRLLVAKSEGYVGVRIRHNITGLRAVFAQKLPQAIITVPGGSDGVNHVRQPVQCVIRQRKMSWLTA